ncbi:hypothetical protein OGAPHI_006389 [Ogataea philodendri]|uniref:Uncharacterized protein n=1 Tax=Ogataea philodendri TaxID=1378263 RepID=A0A9P8NYF6_9ASCO|nr:uncharacterized protein OGAPHI_006389 [Ogataea philodendri]KAH3661541.1 hypothetical protein OGAPHI_006389 [Ogataea philodendri]
MQSHRSFFSSSMNLTFRKLSSDGARPENSSAFSDIDISLDSFDVPNSPYFPRLFTKLNNSFKFHKSFMVCGFVASRSTSSLKSIIVDCARCSLLLLPNKSDLSKEDSFLKIDKLSSSLIHPCSCSSSSSVSNCRTISVKGSRKS